MLFRSVDLAQNVPQTVLLVIGDTLQPRKIVFLNLIQGTTHASRWSLIFEIRNSKFELKRTKNTDPNSVLA
jgi:hypothetical protein